MELLRRRHKPPLPLLIMPLRAVTVPLSMVNAPTEGCSKKMTSHDPTPKDKIVVSPPRRKKKLDPVQKCKRPCRRVYPKAEPYIVPVKYSTMQNAIKDDPGSRCDSLEMVYGLSSLIRTYSLPTNIMVKISDLEKEVEVCNKTGKEVISNPPTPFPKCEK